MSPLFRLFCDDDDEKRECPLLSWNCIWIRRRWQIGQVCGSGKFEMKMERERMCLNRPQYYFYYLSLNKLRVPLIDEPTSNRFFTDLLSVCYDPFIKIQKWHAILQQSMSLSGKSISLVRRAPPIPLALTVIELACQPTIISCHSWVPFQYRR